MTQPSESLYRQQAINAHFAHQYGEVFILPKVSQLWIAGFIALWVSAAGIFIASQPFAQTVEVKGWILTQTTPVHIRAKESAGIVQRIYVNNGELVSAGQPILSISRQSMSLLGENRLQNNIQALKQAYQLKADAIVQKQQSMTSDVSILKKQKNVIANQFAILDQQLSNTHKQLLALHQQKQNLSILAKTNLASKTQVQQANLQWLEAENTKQALHFQRSQLTERLLTTSNQIQNKQHQVKLLGIETQQALMQHEQSLTKIVQTLSYTLHAPNAGRIDNLHIAQGESVELNQQLMQLLPPQSTLKSLLSVPAHQAGFLLASQQVQVKVDGFPYQKYGAIDGIITHISKQVLLPADTTQMPIRLDSPVFMVEVALAENSIMAEGEAWQLTSGMTVNASIRLNQPSILEWLLGPLYTALGV